ncbi:MAG TPA: hypothetical protein PK264_23485, partial [Hyphomicrobiaceae bacterium]|nr:hypothetical protein [Hyphomicrobiaceae bacterium]
MWLLAFALLALIARSYWPEAPTILESRREELPKNIEGSPAALLQARYQHKLIEFDDASGHAAEFVSWATTRDATPRGR